MTKRVAIYGGSFDPPHVCHVLAATWVLCRAPVDEIRLVPVFSHAFSKDLAPFDLRCRMVEAAMAHLRPLVRVDPIEARLSAPSYTIDTVRAMLAEEPELRLSFMMGIDSYRERAAWKAWDELVSLVDLIVLGRGERPAPGDDNEDGDVEVAITLPDVSSSDIRRRIRQGQPIAHLVPQGVREIIEEHGLYTS